MRIWRIVLAVLGIVGVLYGVGRLFTEVGWPVLISVAIWMAAMVIIHDGILSPLIIAVGAVLDRVLPRRARGFVQGGLIMAGLVTAIAIPLLIKQRSYPPSKALLEQNYGLNLAILFAVIAVICLVGYAIRVAHDRRPIGDEDRAEAGITS